MARRPMFTLILAVSITVLGCATTYHPSGFTGGFSEVQIDGNTYTVEFRGNGYTRRQRVETYLMYRCAELTVTAGYDYFVIVGGGTDTKHGAVTTPGSYTSTTTGSATAYGNSAYGTATTTGTYVPGQTFIITKYGASATIRIFNGEKPADHPSAFAAQEVLKYLGPQVKR